MNFFKKILGIHSTTPANVVTGEATTPELNHINEQLFIDQQPPSDLQANRNGSSNPLALFLKKEYASEGYKDGYSYHSADILNSKIRTLCSEFRNLVDIQLEVIRKEIQLMKEHRIEMEGLSGRMVKRLDLSIEGLSETMVQLEAEKANSAAEEGLVMKAVHEYREGFIRGMEDYQVEKLLGGSTGMFN